MRSFLLLAVMGVFFSCTTTVNETSPVEPTEGFTRYVNPFYGTGGFVTRPPDGLWLWEDTLKAKETWFFGGGCFPGAQAPFGMVQLSPDTHDEGYDHNGGYHYLDSTIMGFSHLHTSGNGPELGWILLMPTTGKLQINPGSRENPDVGYRSRYSHDKESAYPGYYQVELSDYGVNAELTATERVGMHRYTFPETDSANIILDLSHKIAWGSVDYPDSVYLKRESPTLWTGYVGRKSKKWIKNGIYFAIELSQAPDSYTTYIYDKPQRADILKEEGARVAFHYKTDAREQVLVKVALSPTSAETALKNMNEELNHWDFGRVVKETRLAWDNQLSKVSTEGGTHEEKVIFYSSLYHTMQTPFLLNDVDGAYTTIQGKVEKPGFKYYTAFSIWDTYRAVHPLYTITQPERVADFAETLVTMAKHSTDSMLPLYSVFGSFGHGMAGHHVLAVLAEAYLKGYRGWDYRSGYEFMKNNAMRDHHGLKLYREMGYIPQDSMNASVAEVLEYAYGDYAIAKMAEALGYEDDYRYFMDRSYNIVNLWDSTTGFFRPKMANGKWMEPFDPRRTSHQWRLNSGFVEANAWQYLWHVQHDVPKLIALLGGNGAFVDKLDLMFDQPSILTGRHTADVSGLIGQYAAGNEPSNHVAYLYNFAGAPWKSQARVRQVMREAYDSTAHGIPGNDDAGQLSAWYVWSAIGFYPVDPVGGRYMIGTPLFEKTRIQLPDDSAFEVVAEGVNAENMYIQSASLNGKSLDRSWITHEELMAGGTLAFTMGNKPNKSWANKPIGSTAF